jgi:hypothetical protein
MEQISGVSEFPSFGKLIKVIKLQNPPKTLRNQNLFGRFADGTGGGTIRLYYVEKKTRGCLHMPIPL